MTIPSAVRVITVTCLVLSSCMTWRYEPTPGTYLTDHTPGKIRITMIDGEIHLLESVRVKGDSLVGFETDADWNGRRVVAPLDQVFKLEVRKVDPVRTLLFTGGWIAYLALP